MILLAAMAALLGPCTVTDGDTIRCGSERIRLLGIDAPELHTCPSYRRCVPGDAPASARHLRSLIRRRGLTIRRVGQDRFGRTLAVVYAGGLNLSCAQVASGHAAYIAGWDNSGMVREECPTIGGR